MQSFKLGMSKGYHLPVEGIRKGHIFRYNCCNRQLVFPSQLETNFLVVILDQNLSCKSEISHVANNVAKSISIIFKCSFFLSRTSLRMLSYSLTYPYFH